MNKQELLDSLIRSEQTYGLIQTLHTYLGNNFQVRLPLSRSTCATSIEELQLSVRSQNALMRASLFSIGDVADVISRNELLKLRNLGKKSHREIKTSILQFCFESLSERNRINFFEDLIELNPSIQLKVSKRSTV